MGYFHNLNVSPHRHLLIIKGKINLHGENMADIILIK